MKRLGVDVGGTFTDFVAYDRDREAIDVWKVMSVPGDPVAGILREQHFVAHNLREAVIFIPQLVPCVKWK